MSRQAFEAFITAPPFEMGISRIDDRGAWPGNYKSYDIDLAWKAWQAATAAALAAPAHPERKPMTDQDTLDLFNRIQLKMLFTDADAVPFAAGVASAEFFHGIKGAP